MVSTVLRMTLHALLCEYLAAREVSSRYRESLLRTVRQAAAGGVENVTDLQSALVNKFLQNLSTAPTTRQNVRRELLTLWRWAFEEGITDDPPLRVFRIKSPVRPVQAWSLAELRAMVACAESDMTCIGGLHSKRINEWLPGWIVIAYDTALRFGDVLDLQDTNIRNGTVCTTAHKTGKPLVRTLSGHAQQWAQSLSLGSPDGTLFKWFLTRRRAFIAMRHFLDRHKYAGSFKYLRRACATYVEMQSPGEAWRYLQHSVPTLVQRHYVDASLCPAPAGPPPIK